jgi:hypothetical protein
MNNVFSSSQIQTTKSSTENITSSCVDHSCSLDDPTKDISLAPTSTSLDPINNSSLDPINNSSLDPTRSNMTNTTSKNQNNISMKRLKTML